MFKTIPSSLLSFIAVLALSLSSQAEDKTHLFLLAGQSNMYYLKSKDSFGPAVEKAFGEDKVIIAKSAKRGAPIRLFDKDYPWAEDREIPQGRKRPGHKERTREEFLGEFGRLCDDLIENSKKVTEGRSYDTVTFVWMQGESDSKKEAIKEYEASFNRVISRLKAELGVKEINVIIGRLSDFGENDTWEQMRQLQMKMADAHDNWAWVNTDDLNDREKNGEMRNDLHYTKEGYVTLGQRFADKAIEILNKQ